MFTARYGGYSVYPALDGGFAVASCENVVCGSALSISTVLDCCCAVTCCTSVAADRCSRSLATMYCVHLAGDGVNATARLDLCLEARHARHDGVALADSACRDTVRILSYL